MGSNLSAQSVLEKVSQDHLECPICSERFKQPKLLECSHSFCLECLQQLKHISPSARKLSCPVCRQVTVLKQNGLDGLQTDLKSVTLLEAFETQEKKLIHQQGQRVPSGEFVYKCSKHTDKDLIMYCNKCYKLICMTCIAKDHSMHPAIELSEALNKSKHQAKEMLSEVRESIKTFNIAIQEIDTSRKTLDSMLAATKEKISKKADEEIAKEVARIREEKQILMQEAEQIYKDRVKTMETAQATNCKEMKKAELKQDEVNELIMDRGNKILHHIKQLLQDLKEYREMKPTKVPDGLTYMDFKEGQKSLGRLVLKNERQVESATSAQTRMPTFQSMTHFKQNRWTFKSVINTYKNIKQQMERIHPQNVAVYSNRDIVVLDWNTLSLFTISAESNPKSTVSLQSLQIKGLTRPISVTVTKYDELIVLDDTAVKIFNRNYQLLRQFGLGGEPSCIAVNDNLIAVGFQTEAGISLHKPDGSLIRTLPAPGIGGYLTTYKERLIYTNLSDCKLVSVDYNGKVVFSVGINQAGWPSGVCCDKDGSIYVAVWKLPLSTSQSGEIQHYSPDGRYIERSIRIRDGKDPRGITITATDDLVVTEATSVQIYHHE